MFLLHSCCVGVCKCSTRNLSRWPKYISIFIICCAIKFCFQIRLIKSLWYRSASGSIQYVPFWIKVSFPGTPKPSSQTISLPISLVLSMQQMEDALSILGLNVNLKTVILRHLSCFYNLNFHPGWRKTVLSCICLSDSLFSCTIQKNSTSLLEDLLRGGEVAWSKSKFYLPNKSA